MKNKLKLGVAAVALVAVGLVAAHPGAASGGDAVRTGMAPVEFGIGGAWFDDLFRNVSKWLRPWWRTAPVLGTKLDDVLRQYSEWPTVRRVQAATSRLQSDERVKVVAEACEVMGDLDDLDPDDWTSYDLAKARIEAANETVSQIIGGVEALQEVLEAFDQGRSDRYLVLGENVVCQAAGLAS